jgi:hypothetical protein
MMNSIKQKMKGYFSFNKNPSTPENIDSKSVRA